MSDETDPGDEGIVDTGDAGEETGVTSTEQPGAGAGGTPPGRQAPVVERTFTQRDVNTYLANERRKWEQSARARVTAPAAAPARPAAAGGTRPFDADTLAALDRYWEEKSVPFREVQVKTEINDAFGTFQASHPEFSTKDVRDAVIQHILDLGEEFVQTAPMGYLLDYGWLKYKYGNFNEEEFRNKTIADHLAGKGTQARKTGTPQGAGGKATTNPKPRGKDWKSADEAMKQLIEEDRAAS